MNRLLILIESNISFFILWLLIFTYQEIFAYCMIANILMGRKGGRLNSNIGVIFSSIPSLSRVWLFQALWTTVCQVTNSEFTQTHVHRVDDAIQPSNPLSSPSPPAFNLSQHQSLFKWVSSSPQVAKVLELQLQRQSFQWIFRTNFFRIDWLDLLAVQGTLRSLLQHSSKASILWRSAFL